jgi:hypothetical protein
MSGESVAGKAAVWVAGGVSGVATWDWGGGVFSTTDSACPKAALLRVKRQAAMNTMRWLRGFHIMKSSPEK